MVREMESLIPHPQSRWGQACPRVGGEPDAESMGSCGYEFSWRAVESAATLARELTAFHRCRFGFVSQPNLLLSMFHLLSTIYYLINTEVCATSLVVLSVSSVGRCRRLCPFDPLRAQGQALVRLSRAADTVPQTWRPSRNPSGTYSRRDMSFCPRTY